MNHVTVRVYNTKKPQYKIPKTKLINTKFSKSCQKTSSQKSPVPSYRKLSNAR